MGRAVDLGLVFGATGQKNSFNSRDTEVGLIQDADARWHSFGTDRIKVLG